MTTTSPAASSPELNPQSSSTSLHPAEARPSNSSKKRASLDGLSPLAESTTKKPCTASQSNNHLFNTLPPSPSAIKKPSDSPEQAEENTPIQLTDKNSFGIVKGEGLSFADDNIAAIRFPSQMIEDASLDFKSMSSVQLSMYSLGFFVKHGDKKIRRIPPHEHSITTGENIESKKIYDAEKEYITEEKAGFKIDLEKNRGYFSVGNQPCEPILTQGTVEIYKVAEGHYLIPQPDSAACTYACEDMLLLDHGYLSIDELKKGSQKLSQGGHSRRSTKELRLSLEKNVKQELIYIGGKVKGKDFKKMIDKLNRYIDKHGPGIFSYGDRGHVVMLDRIEVKGETPYLTIREPFHGTYSVIKSHDDFWRDTDGNDSLIKIEAIFLGENNQETSDKSQEIPDANIASG